MIEDLPPIIIGCGKDKRSRPAAALDLYTGKLFLIARRWALSVSRMDRIFIISAKHGLVQSQTIIAPYNLIFGEAGSVDAATLRSQAERFGLIGGEIIVLASAAYVRRLQQAGLGPIRDPLKGLIIGQRLGVLTRNRGRAI